MSLLDRVLLEYGGVGGRVAGARHPFKIPQPQVRTRKDMTPEMVEKAKRRIEMRSKTREYLRQVALGEARRPLNVLGEAKIDAGKAKVMAKTLRKLWKDTGAILPSNFRGMGSGAQWFDSILSALALTGDISIYDSEFLTKVFPAVVAKAAETNPKLHKVAKAYEASLGRMHDLNVKQYAKDQAAARKLKKSKLNAANIKKFSYVHFFKGGKEHSGKIMWVGPNKFKKGEKSYGVSVGSGKKLVYIGLGHIFGADAPAPAYKKGSGSYRDGSWNVEPDDAFHDAWKDMNAELGTKGVNYSKAEIKKHFGWK